jgi:transposase
MLRWIAKTCSFQVESGWCIRVKMPDPRKDEWLAAALQFKTKYCRIVWKIIRGKLRWFVQLVQDGQTPIKASVLHRLAPEGSVGGIDIGPSNIAWVTGDEAGLQRFAPEVDRPHDEIRRLQRHIDRQRRANNPANYHPDGRAKKGCRNWVRSLGQLKAERRLAEMHRYEADVRRQAHGRDTNFLLSKARIWRDDGVSPKALQKRYGRSVSVRAPGHFMSELTRKAERAGGQRQIIDVRQLKTSQYDHTTDTFRKKPLSQRKHVFGDGRGRVQRDLYSAFLARNSEGNTHQPPVLEKAWAPLESYLQQAGWCVIKPQTAGVAGLQPDFADCQSG